jgi:hypothetical protein
MPHVTSSVMLEEVPLRRALAPMGERFYEVAQALEVAGFTSFAPWLRFTESFCTDSDVELHRQCTIETAKELIGNPHGHTPLDSPRPGGYRSSLLERLREERFQQTGITFATRDMRRPWLVELDPCRKARLLLEFTDRASFDKKRAPFEALVAQARTAEIDHHGFRESKLFSFEPEDRLRLSMYLISQELQPLGFAVDKRFSSKRRPVFSKRVNHDHLITWYLDSTPFLSPSAAELEIFCEVRSASDRKVSGSERGSAILIPYQFVGPLSYVHGSCYRRAKTTQDLAVNLKAHLFVYAQVDAFVTRCIAQLASLG